MERTSYILSRRWCPLRPTCLIHFFYCASSLKQQSTGRHVASLKTHYTNFESTSLCSYSMLQRCNKYIFIVFDFTLPGIETMIYCTRVSMLTSPMWFQISHTIKYCLIFGNGFQDYLDNWISHF